MRQTMFMSAMFSGSPVGRKGKAERDRAAPMGEHVLSFYPRDPWS